MANEYAITAAVDHVSLDANRRGQTTFTVSNRTSRSLLTRARVVAQHPEVSAWFTVLEADRTIPPSETLQFTVNIAVPDTAAEGDYAFRLDVAGVANPDEEHAQGQSVVVTVPPPIVQTSRIPWWIFVIAGVALVIVVATAAFLLTRDGDDDDPPVVVREDQVTLQGGQFYDFDAGVTGSRIEADLEVVDSIADAALRPVNGSQIGMFIPSRRTFDSCDAVTVSTNPIVIDDVGTGNHLCVRTTAGNLTEALIETVSRTRSQPPIIVSIRLSYTTFEGN